MEFLRFCPLVAPFGRCEHEMDIRSEFTILENPGIDNEHKIYRGLSRFIGSGPRWHDLVGVREK